MNWDKLCMFRLDCDGNNVEDDSVYMGVCGYILSIIQSIEHAIKCSMNKLKMTGNFP